MLTSPTQIFAGGTAVVDTTIQHALGTRAFDVAGNEFIYLQGVAGTVAGNWVTFSDVHLTTRTVAGARGRVAIAMAAIDVGRFGWYQIYGRNTIALGAGAIVTGSELYLTATAGQVDDTVVAGDLITGAFSRSTTGAAGPFVAELSYPVVV